MKKLLKILFLGFVGFGVLNTMKVYLDAKAIEEPIGIGESIKLGFMIGFTSVSDEFKNSPGGNRINKNVNILIENQDTIQSLIEENK